MDRLTADFTSVPKAPVRMHNTRKLLSKKRKVPLPRDRMYQDKGKGTDDSSVSETYNAYSEDITDDSLHAGKRNVRDEALYQEAVGMDTRLMKRIFIGNDQEDDVHKCDGSTKVVPVRNENHCVDAVEGQCGEIEAGITKDVPNLRT